MAAATSTDYADVGAAIRVAQARPVRSTLRAQPGGRRYTWTGTGADRDAVLDAALTVFQVCQSAGLDPTYPATSPHSDGGWSARVIYWGEAA